MSREQLHIRVNQEEYAKLERYCKKHKRSKSDVIREFIRSLSDGD
ncbi:MAG: ribbon-helix-helix protein, CopG family [Scytonema sp. RU_4_4]|nr:ribbon-helix-helix protein, CopG family [Scytonema sp. RU_4_4]NJR76638.1 ribbon-helix-helix protein, CopG family [Scytonema sp. CRU_2_7]